MLTSSSSIFRKLDLSRTLRVRIARALGLLSISWLTTACPTEEAGEAVCGDGVLALGEECDDGADNGFGYGGCNVDCTLGAFCGDGVLDEPEQCDDGAENGFGYGGCNADCTLGGSCGDGVVDELEECDDGNAESGDGCDAGCRVEVGFVCEGARCVPLDERFLQ